MTTNSYLTHCGPRLVGDTLIAAIEKNFDALAKHLQLGNAAGYRLIAATVAYSPSILGGRGGAELHVIHLGLSLAHRPADPTPRVATAWIACSPADLPQPHTYTIAQ